MFKATRRGFLRTTLGPSWAAATLMEQSVMRAAAARGQARTAPSGLFTIEKMADGVYGAIARPATITNCHAVIFENAADLLVVDTHSKPSAAAALIAQIRKELTKKPVRYLVNSHFHWDHTQGTAPYRKDSPKLDIIASEATRRLLAEGAVERLKASLEGARQSLDVYKKRLADAKTDEEKANLRRMTADTESYIKEMAGYQPDLPNITVKGDLILHDKAHELNIVFRGRGHTSGDVSVWCPSKKVAATGDLAHGSLPYIGDGFPIEWPATLVAVGMLGFDKFLGGHGGVQTGLTRLYQMRDYIEEVTVLVQQGKQRGRPLAEIQKQITPATLKSLAGGYAKALEEAGVQALDRGIANNVAQIYAALDRRLDAA